MSVSKHQIFASNDLREALIDIPEWGGKVKIKALSVQEQLDYDSFLATKPKEIDMALHLIIVGCINDDGTKKFDIDDISELKKKNSENIFKLVAGILTLNKQSPEDVDNLAKNS